MSSSLIPADRLHAIELLATASLAGTGAGRLADVLATGADALELLRPGDPSPPGSRRTRPTAAQGEIGHISVDPQRMPCGCGGRGCLETFASEP